MSPAAAELVGWVAVICLVCVANYWRLGRTILSNCDMSGLLNDDSNLNWVESYFGAVARMFLFDMLSFYLWCVRQFLVHFSYLLLKMFGFMISCYLCMIRKTCVYI